MVDLIKVILLSAILVGMGYILVKISRADLGWNVSSVGVLSINGENKALGLPVSYKEIFYSFMLCDTMSGNGKKVKLVKIYAYAKYGNFVSCSNGVVKIIEKPTNLGTAF